VKCWMLVEPEPDAPDQSTHGGWYLHNDGRLYKGPPLEDDSNLRGAWMAHIPPDTYTRILRVHGYRAESPPAPAFASS
jgi:hypothetical protein